VFEEIRDLGSIESRRFAGTSAGPGAECGFHGLRSERICSPRAEVSEKEIDQLFASALQLLALSPPAKTFVDSIARQAYTFVLESD